MAVDRLDEARNRLRASRRVTKSFVDGLSPDEWFWQPHDGGTHVAWQVGHLAVAQYNLCLKRVRGVADQDEQLIPSEFVEAFKLGSLPAAAAQTPPQEQIVAVFDRVLECAVAELSELSVEQLKVPTHPPHPVFGTKLGAVEWCSQHELIHAGQIALLRRLMGKPPLR